MHRVPIIWICQQNKKKVKNSLRLKKMAINSTDGHNGDKRLKIKKRNKPDDGAAIAGIIWLFQEVYVVETLSFNAA